MLLINEDLSIFVTRGDAGAFAVETEVDGEPYIFQVGEVVRLKVFEKKNCDNVVLQKDIEIFEPTEEVKIILEENETRIGETISKPVDYWYEVELNPFTRPQTIIGYDDEGAKIFRLFPEGRELEDDEITEEDIPIVDEELDLKSPRPVQNHAITKEILRVKGTIEILAEDHDALVASVEEVSARVTNIASLDEGSTTGDAELIDIRVGKDGETYASAGEAVRKQFTEVANKLKDSVYYVKELVNGTVTFGGSSNVTDPSIANNTVRGNFAASGYVSVGGVEDNYLLVGGHTYRVATYMTHSTASTSGMTIRPIRASGLGTDFFANVSKDNWSINDVTPKSDCSLALRGAVATALSGVVCKVYVYDITDIPSDVLAEMDFTNEKSYQSVLIANDTKNTRRWYKGKKLVTFGDNSVFGGMWQQYLENDFGLVCANKGVDWSRVGGNEEYSMHQDIRINALDEDADVIAIMGGINDSRYKVAIGDLTLSNTDTSTFVGALNAMLSKIYYRYFKIGDFAGVEQIGSEKEVKIYLMSPPYVADEQFSGVYGSRLKEYAKAIKNVAELWHLPYVPVFENCQINHINSTKYLTDAIDLNSEGGKLVASVVMGYLEANEPVGEE